MTDALAPVPLQFPTARCAGSSPTVDIFRNRERRVLPDDGILRGNFRSFSYDVEKSGTVLVMHGNTATGQTIRANVSGINPYFMIAIEKHTDVSALVRELNSALTVASLFGSFQRSVQEWCTCKCRHTCRCTPLQPVQRVSTFEGRGIRSAGPRAGYDFQETQTFLKVEVHNPRMVSVACDLLHKCVRSPEEVLGYVVESQNRVKEEHDFVFDEDGQSVVPVKIRKKLKNALAECQPFFQHAAAPGGATASTGTHIQTPNLSDATKRTLERVMTEFPTYTQLGQNLEVFEADVNFPVRACIELGIFPEEWVCFTDAVVRDDTLLGSGWPRILVYASASQVYRDPNEETQLVKPPQIVLSVDAEMDNVGSFPVPEKEPILKICAVASDPFNDQPGEHLYKYTFQLKESAIEALDTHEWVWSFDNEASMLVAFSRFLQVMQPDAITGWNVEDFDFKYFLRRADVLGVPECAYFTRHPEKKATIRETEFESDAHGNLKLSHLRGEGLFSWDLLTSFKKNTQFPLTSYALNAVALKVLGESKQDVSYGEIHGLQQTPEGRERLRQYCIQDCVLPIRMIHKLALFMKETAFASMNGVPLQNIVSNGMQIRVKALFYRESAANTPRECFLTRTPEQIQQHSEFWYPGAFVVDPVSALHKGGVPVLDFASLYPSVIRAGNMCIQTFLTPEQADAAIEEGRLSEEDIIRRCDPSGRLNMCFVKNSVYDGLTPRVVRKLLKRRKAIKKLMKTAKDEGNASLALIYDMLQQAVKVNANSVYGALGAAVSCASCPWVAFAVTYEGQCLIRSCIAYVKEHCPTFTVVYGDTDSIFVLVPPDYSPERAATECIELAHNITKHLRAHYHGDEADAIDLEFEKVYFPLLLVSKKKYAGILFEMKHDKLVRKGISISGMEDKRRDSSAIVGETLSTCLNLLLTSTGTDDERVQLVAKHVATIEEQIRTNQLPLDKLVETRQLRKARRDYLGKDTSIPLHVMLVEKLKERNGADNAPKSGDRVEMLFVDRPKKSRKSSGVEDPWYAVANNMHPSYEHYVLNRMYPTVIRVLTPILAPSTGGGTPEERKRKATDRFYEVMRNVTRPRLLSMHRATTQQPTRGFAALVRKRKRCQLCGNIADGSVCTAHTAAERAEYQAVVDEHVARVRNVRAETWNTCYTCAHGDNSAVPALSDVEDIATRIPCKSTACPTYSVREGIAHPNNKVWVDHVRPS